MTVKRSINKKFTSRPIALLIQQLLLEQSINLENKNNTSKELWHAHLHEKCKQTFEAQPPQAFIVEHFSLLTPGPSPETLNRVPVYGCLNTWHA
jgi:hypothetical protein